jgi:hypothetical protein
MLSFSLKITGKKMARLVPATIQSENEEFSYVLAQLEKIISDDFIIFQNILGNQNVIIGGEGLNWRLVHVVLDTDEQLIENDRINQLPYVAKGIAEGASSMISQGILPILLLSNAGSTTIAGDITTFSSIEGLTASLVKNEGDTSVNDVNRVIKVLAKGSSEYVPGTITKAQVAFRKKTYEKSDEAEALGEYTHDDKNITSPPKFPVKNEVIVLNNSSAKRVKHVEDLVRSCIINLAGGDKIMSCGVDVNADFVAESDSMLPIVLAAASDKWASVVVQNSGMGGFDIRISRDPEALVGMRVIDVLVSSPFLLFMPIAHAFKQCRENDGFNMDQLIAVFSRWVEKYGLDDTVLNDIDTNTDLKTEDGDAA